MLQMIRFRSSKNSFWEKAGSVRNVLFYAPISVSFRCVHKVGGSSQYFTRNYEYKKRRCRLSLPNGFDQYTFYFQINFQAFGGILGLDVILERAGDNMVAIAL